MKTRIGFAWALGILLAPGCGGDAGGNGDETTGPEPSTSSGACGKGKYPGGAGTLTLCGPDAMDTACMPIEKFRGYSQYAGDIDVFAGSLADLSTLSCLKSVGKLTISGSSALTDLRGLESLTSASAVELLGNAKLTSLRGLAGVTKVVQITINSNDSLTDIVGLPDGFTTSSLYVEINDNLTSLDGLKNISVTGKIDIEGNRKLSKCVVDRFTAGFAGVKVINIKNLEETCT